MGELSLILYIEDEPAVRQVVKRILERTASFHLVTCRSGFEAFQILSICSFDLILLDIMMPGLDGFTTLKILRSSDRFANTPIIFLTAGVLPYEVASYMPLGVLGTIPKPFEANKLAQTIQELWEDWRFKACSIGERSRP